MKAIMVSSLDQWFPSEEIPPFPYDRGSAFEEARWDPLVVLHTSGSTGIPKPIVCRQGMIAISDAYHDLPEWQGTRVWLQAWEEMADLLFAPSMQPALS